MRVTATLSGWELLLRRNTYHDRFTIMSNLKFLHFPVAAKAVLLIAALGLLSIAANWFCLERLDEFDRLNATLTRHLAPARLALAEAKAASESFGVAVYKDYSASDPDQAKESVEEMEGQYNAARRALNNCAGRLSGRRRRCPPHLRQARACPRHRCRDRSQREKRPNPTGRAPGQISNSIPRGTTSPVTWALTGLLPVLHRAICAHIC